MIRLRSLCDCFVWLMLVKW